VAISCCARQASDGRSVGAWIVPRFLDRVFEVPLAVLDDVGQTVLLTVQAVAWLFRPPFRGAQVIRAMEFIGVQSIFLISLTGMFSGMVLALQMVHALKAFNQQGLVGGIVAVSLTREISPVFSGLMVTARAGSALAAELGNMRVTEQIDAITTMGVSPVQYLVVPRVLATTIVLPLLGLCFAIAGMFGAWLVAVVWQGIDPGIFFERIETFVKWADVRMLLAKSAIFGVIVSTICCKKGFHASGGARGVGEATAKAVVSSIVAIFAADYVVTTIMTDV
jgi:phospholipid/cholesterol/gamma-HCH transport system permease protein